MGKPVLKKIIISGHEKWVKRLGYHRYTLIEKALPLVADYIKRVDFIFHKVFVFGSILTPKFRPDSDIDFGIEVSLLPGEWERAFRALPPGGEVGKVDDHPVSITLFPPDALEEAFEFFGAAIDVTDKIREIIKKNAGFRRF